MMNQEYCSYLNQISKNISQYNYKNSSKLEKELLQTIITKDGFGYNSLGRVYRWIVIIQQRWNNVLQSQLSIWVFKKRWHLQDVKYLKKNIIEALKIAIEAKLKKKMML